MKILHTSDLHIGKRLMDRERLPEQVAVLDELTAICERENVALVIIAGDVFDTFLPSSEAEEVFYSALKKLAGETRAVVIISGNHDDGVRLSACAPLAEEQGVYIYGGTPRVFKTGGNRPVRVLESGENWLVLGDGTDSVYINALPYPNEARLKEEKTEEAYSEKIKRWVERGEAGYRGDMPHILLTHLFVAGGKTSDSERGIDLGGARAVPLSALPQEGYVALGHLHRKQSIGHARYSGSVLQYSFDETSEKSVILLETAGNSFTQREIPLTSGKKLVRLECEGLFSALQLLPQYQNCFVELTLHLSEPLTTQETQNLREANDGLVSLITKLPESEHLPEKSRSVMSGKELFGEYYRSLYGEEPKEELLQAFLEMTEAEE